MRYLKIGAVLLLGLVVLAVALGLYLHRRALPLLDGVVTVAGAEQPVEILRDRWGVPHIFAQSERDAYYGLGWATAQDRLFQIAMLNQAVRGRLSEWFGEDAVEIDVLFRTLDFHGIGQALYAGASAEARAAMAAYQQGVNDYAEFRDSSLPIEFALLRQSFEPLEPGDLVGVLGFMSFMLHDAWRFEPLYARLVDKLGADAVEGLFPQAGGAHPAVYETAGLPQPERFRLSAAARELLALLPRPTASNNWAIAPSKSASGHALLGSDPHLGHAIPPIWYEAHLSGGGLDVAGVTIPGVPFIVIGHNRDIAWGFTNLMVDAGDYFIERLKPDNPDLVMHEGRWVPVEIRKETIEVRGAEPVELEVRITPHGPVVSELVDPPSDQVLAYQWTYWRVEGDLDAFYDLSSATGWTSFRAAARQFQVVTQNVAYADREGHIAMQTVGAIPLRTGEPTGMRYRIGWDGSQEWRGYVPFEELPFELDPPRGWVASANNPTFAPPAPYYVAAHFEPLDRITRLRELLAGRETFSIDDAKALQADTVWVSAVRGLPRLQAAFFAQPPEGIAAGALAQLEGWDGDMGAESPAAAIYAIYYERLFEEVFTDELGEELVADLREMMNLNATMLWSVMEQGRDVWFDRVDTATVEGEGEIARAAFARAVAWLEARLGSNPAEWRWGELHQLEFVHPLGRVAALAPYFNLGPHPVPGHNNTPNKMQFKADLKVFHGPSMRQITDLGDLDGALSVLPTGQSGVPASEHYGDQSALWLNGEYHTLPLGRAAVEAIATHRLQLAPP